MKVYIVGDNEGAARYAFADRDRAEQCKKDHQFGLEMSGSYRIAHIIELELDERPLHRERPVVRGKRTINKPAST